MEVVGLSHPRGARSAAARGSNGAGERRRPRPGAVRSKVVRVAATPPRTDDSPAAAAEAADQSQAEYFVRLLTQNRRVIEHRIDEYDKAIAAAEANGDVEGARTFRRMALGEEQDRRTVDGLLDQLRRRFPSGGVSPLARRAPSIRQDRPGANNPPPQAVSA